MSRESDVIGKCTAAADSLTKRFYFMTSLVGDDLDCLLTRYDTEHSEPTEGQADRVRPVQGRVGHGEHDERERESSHCQGIEYGQEIQQGDDDGRQDDDDDDDTASLSIESDVRDETLRHSDTVNKSLNEISQQHPGAVRRQSAPCLDLDLDSTRIDVDLLGHWPTTYDLEQNDNTIPTVSAPLCDVSVTRTKLRRNTDDAEDIGIQRQRHSSRMTTNSQPISDQTETTGNRISFDRKLIDEIDAVMARNGCKPLRHSASTARTAHSPAHVSTACFSHGPAKSPESGSGATYDHAHSDHVTGTVDQSGESHNSCDVEDCERRLRRRNTSTGRKRRRRRTRVKHETAAAAAAATVTGL